MRTVRARIAELEMLLRDVYDPLLISAALLRKYGYDIEKLRNALEAMIRLHNGDGPSAVPHDERVATVEAACKVWLETQPKD